MTPHPLVVELMETEIARVKRQRWWGLPDKVCGKDERTLRDKHEASSYAQAEQCRQNYLHTSRARLKRYKETGEIG